MNRKQKRKSKVKTKDPIYNLKQSDIDKFKREAIDKSFVIMLCLPMMVMRDKYGFGKKRMEIYIDHVLELKDSFDKGYITFNDCIDTLKEEIGMTFSNIGGE